MGTKHQNMIQLLDRLKKQPMSQSDIASHFGVDTRTVIRYLKELQQQKIQLVTQQVDGRRKKYYIQDEEQFATKEIADLRHVVEDLSLAGNHKHARIVNSLLNKLSPKEESEGVLPSLQTVHKEFYINHGPLAEHESDSSRAQKLLLYIQEQKVIRLSYRSRESGEFQKSEPFFFEPYKVALRVGRLYLIGFVEGEDKPKQIPVSKIVRLNATGRHFNKHSFNLDQFYLHSFGQWIDHELQPEEVIIKINQVWIENLLRDSNFNPQVEFKCLKNFTQAKIKIKISPDFKNWLFGMMPGLQVMHPKSLKKELTQRAQLISST